MKKRNTRNVPSYNDVLKTIYAKSLKNYRKDSPRESLSIYFGQYDYPLDESESTFLRDNYGYDETFLKNYIDSTENPSVDDYQIYLYYASHLLYDGNPKNDEEALQYFEKVKNIEGEEGDIYSVTGSESCFLSANYYHSKKDSLKTLNNIDEGLQNYPPTFDDENVKNYTVSLITDCLTNDFLEGKNGEDIDSIIKSYGDIIYSSRKNSSIPLMNFVDDLNDGILKNENISYKVWSQASYTILEDYYDEYDSDTFLKNLNDVYDNEKMSSDDFLDFSTKVFSTIGFSKNAEKYIKPSIYSKEITSKIIDGEINFDSFLLKFMETSKDDACLLSSDDYTEVFTTSISLFTNKDNEEKIQKIGGIERISTGIDKSIYIIKNEGKINNEDFLSIYKNGYEQNFFNTSQYLAAVETSINDAENEGSSVDDLIEKTYGDVDGLVSNLLDGKEISSEDGKNISEILSRFINSSSLSSTDVITSVQKSISDSSKNSISVDEVVSKARVLSSLVEATSDNKDEQDRVSKETATNAILTMLDEGVKNGKITTDQKVEALNKLKEEKTISEETYESEMKKMFISGELGIPQQTSSIEETLKLDKIKLTAKDADGKNWYDKIIGYKFGKREGDIIDIISDYGWTINTFKSGSGNNGINKENNIPFCYAIEYQQLYNASISNIIQSLVGLVSSTQHAVEGTVDAISNIFGKLTGFLTEIAVKTFQSDSAVNGTPLDAESVGNDASKMIEGIGDRIKGGVNGVGESLNGIIARFTRTGQSPVATGSGLLAPYLLMYCVKPTNRKYCFPMLDKSSSYFKAVNKMEEKDGGMGSSILGNKLFSTIANVGRTMMGIAEDIEQIAPFLSGQSVADGGTRQYHIERSKYFSYPSDGEEIETSFVLYNTVKQNIWKDHYKFIMGFMLRNLPFKYDVVAYYPPLFYDVHVPGVKRCPFCYVDNFDVSPLGLTRNLKISGKDFGIGADKTLYSVNVPEAWMVKVKFKSLLATSSNQILSGFIDTPITSNASDGSPEITTQPNA